MTTRPANFDYQAYLASREWSLLRERVRERSGNRCEHCCHARQQSVHHLTYKNLGNEDLHELLAVCEPCHEFLSGKSDHNPLKDHYLVTPRINKGSFDVHWLLLISPNGRPAPPPLVRSCNGSGCIWCRYGTAGWEAFVVADWMPT